MLLFITRKFPPSIGGMEKFNYQLFSHFREVLPTKLVAWGGSQCWLFLIIPYFVLKATFYLLRYPQIEIIYIGDSLLAPLGLLLKILFKKPVVVIVYGLDIIWGFPPYQLIIPYCLKKCDRMICISTNTQLECIKRGIPSTKTTIISPGINIVDTVPDLSEKERLAWLRAEHHIDFTAQKILLTVGRLIQRKGVHTFIQETLPRILEKNKQVIYCVVGEGPQKFQIEQIIAEKNLGAYVRMMGKIDDALLKTMYRHAHVFIMPNIPVPGDLEGFGIVLLEAGLWEIPVVASDLEGIKEAIRHEENGLLVPPLDYQKFADVVLNLLANPGYTKELGQKSRNYIIKNYSWPVIVQKFLKEFKTLMNSDISS